MTTLSRTSANTSSLTQIHSTTTTSTTTQIATAAKVATAFGAPDALPDPDLGVESKASGGIAVGCLVFFSALVASMVACKKCKTGGADLVGEESSQEEGD